MVFIGGWRTQRPGYGPYGPYRRGPYQRGGYGYRNDSCLRDLCLIQSGCCLAEMVGCGPQLTVLGPTIARTSFRALRGDGDGASTHPSRIVRFLVAAIRIYQTEISAKRRHPCCRYSPSCSSYAIEALEAHGPWRGGWLSARRILRCRPGTRGGSDPVPPAVAVWSTLV